MRFKKIWQYVITTISLLLVESMAFALPSIPGLFQWTMQGGSELNLHQSFAPLINQHTIKSLKQTDLGALAGLNIGRTAVTPSVAPSFLNGKPVSLMYVSDANGYLYCFDVTNNVLIWKKSLQTDYSPQLGGLTVYANYITPTIVDDLILIGSNYPGDFTPHNYNVQDGAILMAINRYDGQLIWFKQLDNHPTALITASPVVHNGIAYVGISSYESGTQGILSGSIPSKNYTCCTFRGNVVAVNMSDGSIKWRRFLMPMQSGEEDYANRATGSNSFSGSAVWGGQVAFDAKRNQVIVTTGQTHTYPATSSVHALPAGTANDAIVALDAETGNINWMHNFGLTSNPADMLHPIRADFWNESCIAPLLPFVYPGAQVDPNAIQTYCRSDLTFPAGEYAVTTTTLFAAINTLLAYIAGQATPTDLVVALLTLQFDSSGVLGSDRDFPQGPMVLYDVKMQDGSKRDLIVAMQKSSIMHAVDASTGASVWNSAPLGGGPGSAQNSKASAYDGKYIYAKDMNGGAIPLTVRDINGNVSTTTGSVIAALDPATGNIVWSTALPDSNNPCSAFIPGSPATFGRTSYASMTVVNDMLILGDDFQDVNPLFQYFGICPHDPASYLYAYDTNTGKLITTYTLSTAGNPAGTALAPAVVGNSVYWATGTFHPNDPTRQTSGQIIKLSP